MRREDAQDTPDTGVRTIFRLGVFFMIDFAVLIRPDIFAALEIETEQNRDAGIAGPINLAVAVHFL